MCRTFEVIEKVCKNSPLSLRTTIRVLIFSYTIKIPTKSAQNTFGTKLTTADPRFIIIICVVKTETLAYLPMKYFLGTGQISKISEPPNSIQFK